MTVFCAENEGSRHTFNRLHGVTSQHVATLKLKVMSKGNLTRKTTALYICILLVPRGFENRKQSVKHCAIYADIKPPKVRWLLYVPPSGHYMYRPVVTICTARLTLNYSTFSPHSVFVCFVWI